MRSNKGFTLIEVLTVIVVLAIIALIAVPVIMGIVGKAQKSAFKDSAYELIKAGDLLYSTNEMEGAILERKTFTFPSDTKDLDVKGELPTGGKMVVYENGEVAMAVTSGKYCATKKYGSKEVVVTENTENCELPKLELGDIIYFDPTLGEKGMLCTEGDYLEKNSKTGHKEGCMKWYVYNSDGNESKLILDHNVTKRFNLNVKDNTNFITELMSQLKKDTSTWKVDADVIELDTLLNLMPYYQNLSENEKDNWYEGYMEKIGELAASLIPFLEDKLDNTNNICDLTPAIYEKEVEFSNSLESGSILLPEYFYIDLVACVRYGEEFVLGEMDFAYWIKTVDKSTDAWILGSEGVHVLSPAGVDLINSKGEQFGDVGIRPIITITQ